MIALQGVGLGILSDICRLLVRICVGRLHIRASTALVHKEPQNVLPQTVLEHGPLLHAAFSIRGRHGGPAVSCPRA